MIKNPQTILEGSYHVVPRTIVFLVLDEKVLLQKAPDSKKIFPGCYNGIGGHIERGESVLEGARRELQEETGLTCDNLRLAGTIMIDVDAAEGILLFVLTGDQVQGELVDSEEGSLHWIPIPELETFKVVEDIPELVNRVREYDDTGAVFFGKYLYDDNGRKSTTWLTAP